VKGGAKKNEIKRAVPQGGTAPIFFICHLLLDFILCYAESVTYG